MRLRRQDKFSLLMVLAWIVYIVALFLLQEYTNYLITGISGFIGGLFLMGLGALFINKGWKYPLAG